MGDVICANNLAKSYGSLRAVDDVSFSVRSGEFFGILGPNGAGKTTTLEILEGLRAADAGEATLLGTPSWPRNQSLLRRIGVQLLRAVDSPRADPDLRCPVRRTGLDGG
jgi:ABC-2 type transport system ATP-binding protein